MILKLLNKVFNRKSSHYESAAQPIVISRQHHGIQRLQIAPCALKIITQLQQAGYSSYIVGGAARDLLFGFTPKDYDVATNATPEQIRRIFRRSRIIGRRFRLVHVMCGSDIVEVSTFRGSSKIDDAAQTDPHGRLLHDNVFGTQEEDAARRDFTVNALLYDPNKEEIIDYVNGYGDIQAKKLRIIGDPTQRYREDPVRMLRAIRFASKLGLQIDDSTAQPISELAPLLQNVPVSRLFDEMLKLLLSGHALACVTELRARGLHHGLLPMLDVILEQPLGKQFITLALKNTDERVQQNKPVSAGFLFATLLWHEVLSNWNTLRNRGEKTFPALFSAISQTLAIQHKKLAIPQRFDTIMQEIWTLQPRFEMRVGRRPFQLIAHPRFRSAYDFMLLRCESGEFDIELKTWWEDFLDADPEKREQMLVKSPLTKTKRRRRRKKAVTQASASVVTAMGINQ